jgi:hypothetical protein
MRIGFARLMGTNDQEPSWADLGGQLLLLLCAVELRTKSLQLERRRGGRAAVERRRRWWRAGLAEEEGRPGLRGGRWWRRWRHHLQRHLWRRSWGRSRLDALDGVAVLVVVHPDLEHAALDTDLLAKGVHHVVVLVLQAPPHALRELEHPRLLLRRELCAEPLLRRPDRHRPARAVHLVRLRGAVHRRAQRHGVHEWLVVVERHGAHRRGVVGALVEVRHGGGDEAAAVAATEAAVGGGDVVVVQHLAVEVAVASAGRAPERSQRALLAAGHELAAPVGGVAADRRRVVLQALPVLQHQRSTSTMAASSTLLSAGAPLLHRRGLVPIVVAAVAVLMAQLMEDMATTTSGEGRGGRVHWDRELALGDGKVHASCSLSFVSCPPALQREDASSCYRCSCWRRCFCSSLQRRNGNHGECKRASVKRPMALRAQSSTRMEQNPQCLLGLSIQRHALKERESN